MLSEKRRGSVIIGTNGGVIAVIGGPVMGRVVGLELRDLLLIRAFERRPRGWTDADAGEIDKAMSEWSTLGLNDILVCVVDICFDSC